jgi:hypothetical protein
MHGYIKTRNCAFRNINHVGPKNDIMISLCNSDIVITYPRVITLDFPDVTGHLVAVGLRVPLGRGASSLASQDRLCSMGFGFLVCYMVT